MPLKLCLPLAVPDGSNEPHLTIALAHCAMLYVREPTEAMASLLVFSVTTGLGPVVGNSLMTCTADQLKT